MKYLHILIFRHIIKAGDIVIQFERCPDPHQSIFEFAIELYSAGTSN
jgi:hypothetical protein